MKKEAKIKTKRFRGLRPGFIVSVLEGEGVPSNPARTVEYIFEENGSYIGKIDPMERL